MPVALVPVPTCAELALRGLAEVVERNKKGEATIYKIKSEGFTAIYDAMKHNARLLSSDEVLRKQYEVAAVMKAKRDGGKK